MSFSRCAVLLLILALAGCHPGSQGTADEQKEPYYLAAKKRLQARRAAHRRRLAARARQAQLARLAPQLAPNPFAQPFVQPTAAAPKH